MINFKVKVKSVQYIPELKLKPAQVRQIANTAINGVKERVQKRHTDVNEVQMPGYSPKPVYIKVGMLGGEPVLKSGRISIISLKALKKSGVKIIQSRGSGFKANVKKAIAKTSKYVRFPNRAAYKRALGRSGKRDLTETGKMLNALVMISQSGIYAKVITIGFKDPKQIGKAEGNARITDWLGVSVYDQYKIRELVERIIRDNLRNSKKEVRLPTISSPR